MGLILVFYCLRVLSSGGCRLIDSVQITLISAFYLLSACSPLVRHASGFTDAAAFVIARTGSRALLIDGHKYVKDRETSETINWRCSNFIRYKCRSRAITRTVLGVERVKLTNASHSHQPMFGGADDDSGS